MSIGLGLVYDSGLCWCDVRCYIVYYIILLYYILYYTLLFSSSFPLTLQSIFSFLHLSLFPLPFHLSLLYNPPILSSLPIPSHHPIQSIRVGVYCWILISPHSFSCLLSFLSSSHLLLSPPQYSHPITLFQSSKPPHSKYTCRHLDILIYVLPASDNSDPACFIGVDG